MPKLQQPVIFSHFTALQIHSGLDLGGLPVAAGCAAGATDFPAPAPTRITQAPDRPIPAQELQDACLLISGMLRADSDAKPHIITATKSQYRNLAFANMHLCTANLPSGSIMKVTRNIYVCSPELALFQIATTQIDKIALLELAYEACGTYRHALRVGNTHFDTRALCSKKRLSAFATRHSSIHGSKRTAEILPYLADGSASPMETKLALLCCLPIRLGGYGLGLASLNHKVNSSDHALAIAKRAHFRCDICWPEWKVDLEYQSKFAHEGETARIRDSRRANALASMGWTVIGVTNEEIESISACDAIAAAVRRAMGTREPRRPADYKRRQKELRWELGLPG